MTNPFFNTQFYDQEADLIYSLSDELIYNSGLEIEYLKRDVVRKDPILNEPLSSQFNEVFRLDVAVESASPFFAGNEIFGPVGLTFGLESTSLAVSRRKFISTTGLDAPREGDLVFISQNKMIFEIVNVNAKDPLLSGGRQFVYVMYVQPFRFGEGKTTFDTGSKFGQSRVLEDVLSDLLERVDQTMWENIDSSSIEFNADTIELSSSHVSKSLGEIIRADNVNYTADCTLTADDVLRVFDDSAKDILEVMDERIPNYAQNGEFECQGKNKIVNDSNPFGFW